MRLKQVLDKALIEEQVSTDPIRALYHLGDLDEYYFKKCSWYFVYYGDHPITIILLYKTWGVTILPLGEPDGLRFFLKSDLDELPDRFYGVWMTEHDAVMDGCFDIPDKKRMNRMVVTGASFKPSPVDNKVVCLNSTHADAVRVLLQSYPDNFFEEYQLATGYYRGILDGGKLISMAGVHTINREKGVAAIGNVVTDEAYRGQGLARSVTSKLVADLLCDHKLVGLNVGRDNEPAVRVYKRLGFDIGVQFYEGFCLKRKPLKS